MPYSHELFNRYKGPLDTSKSMVSRAMMGLLKPNDGFPKTDDKRLREAYDIWRVNCRAMDVALNETWYQSCNGPMITMPPDDEEHRPCRRMAAVIIERTVWDEHIAAYHLASVVADVMASPHCASHPISCACHRLDGWTYKDTVEAIQQLTPSAPGLL